MTVSFKTQIQVFQVNTLFTGGVLNMRDFNELLSGLSLAKLHNYA